MSEARRPQGPSAPTLAELAEILRNRSRWPEGFEWDFNDCRTCAMGLAKVLVDGAKGVEKWHIDHAERWAEGMFGLDWREVRELFGVEVADRYEIAVCEVTPEQVAMGIENWLGPSAQRDDQQPQGAQP